jgi:hypothetical protein
MKNISILLLFLFYSLNILSQNSGDTTTIKFNRFKILKINTENLDDADEWDFVAEKIEEVKDNIFLSNQFLLGTNGYTNKVYSLEFTGDYKNMEINLKRSRSFTYNRMLSGLDMLNKRIFISPGFGFTWNNYFFANPVSINSNNDTTFFQTDTLHHLKYKLRSSYIELPLLLGFRIGNLNKKYLGFKIGATFSYKLNSSVINKIIIDKTTYRTKITDNFNLSPFLLSINSQISYGNIGVFSRISLTPLFSENKTQTVYPFSIGLLYGNINTK